MATTKKKTTTKKAVPKKTVSRSTAVKKTPARKSTATKRVSRKKAPVMRSFHIAKENQEFNQFKVTRQTVYWIILVAFIIFAQLWILKLQVDVATLIDNQQQALLSM